MERPAPHRLAGSKLPGQQPDRPTGTGTAAGPNSGFGPPGVHATVPRHRAATAACPSTSSDYRRVLRLGDVDACRNSSSTSASTEVHGFRLLTSGLSRCCS